MKILLPLLIIVFLASRAFADTTVLPDSGPIGIPVIITGEGFGKFISTKNNMVLFGKAPGLVEQWDNSKIVARVPRKATTGPIFIKNGKKSKQVGTFTVETPLIKEVSPAAASPGHTIQIIGRDFGPTIGQKDSEMQFGVNEVLFNGIPGEVVRWRDSRIEVKVPSNASSGPLTVRLASVDPLPDGSCCAPVNYSVSKPVSFTVMTTLLVEPTEGPVGSPVVISGDNLGQMKPGEDAVLFNGVPGQILEWANNRIRASFPLNGSSGPVTLKKGGESRLVGEFRLMPHRVIGMQPDSAPVGTLITINGQNFGVFSDSGPNQVLFGGVPGRVFQWTDRMIHVWVPVSAQTGAVVVRRGAAKLNENGSCCAERGFAVAEAGEFTLAVPKVSSITPDKAEIGSVITIKGSGFGDFIKTDERTQDNISREGHLHKFTKFSENTARTAVLFPAKADFVKASHIAGIVESWTDNEITVRVPRLADGGEIVIRRGSWDLLPDGTCCKDKQWLETPAGHFTPSGLEDIDRDYRKNLPKQGGDASF
jgi:IPT/TIG domain-containing protein